MPPPVSAALRKNRKPSLPPCFGQPMRVAPGRFIAGLSAGASWAMIVNVQNKVAKAVECLSKDRDALLAFYRFPVEH